MPTFDQGDIVRVPFPYTSLGVEEHRPALVFSDGALGKGGFLIWVLMITSVGSRAWPGDVIIDDLEQAGLPAPSLVRTLKIAGIEASRASLLGHLERAAWRKVQSELRRHLGWAE